MTIVRYGAGEVGAGGQALPFARAVQADGWLHVSGQVAMHNGEIVAGGIIAQSHKAIQNLLAILEEAGRLQGGGRLRGLQVRRRTAVNHQLAGCHDECSDR